MTELEDEDLIMEEDEDDDEVEEEEERNNAVYPEDYSKTSSSNSSSNVTSPRFVSLLIATFLAMIWVQQPRLYMAGMMLWTKRENL